MVSITHCWRKHCWRNVSLTLLAALLFLLGASSARAGSIEPERSQLNLTDAGYVLSADFAIELGDRLEEAVGRGVPLNFNLEFTIERIRWYWLNERVASRNIEYRLSYNALTQQYRLTAGGLHTNFGSLAEALRVLSRVSDLVVAEKSAVKLGNSYVAELRLSLDKSQLPKPLQLDVIAGKDWQVDAKTLRWQFAPGVVGR
jgi:hypothetical protein